MAKQDNNGQKLFGTEFNGFNKKQVTEYIASLEKKYNDAIRQKTDEAEELENSYNELQDKYAELFDSYMVLQDEKAKIADVLIGAENRAAEIVEQAKSDAEKERAALETQSEVLRESIVDRNKIIKDMKASANAMVAEFESTVRAMIDDMCAAMNDSIADLNGKADIITSAAIGRNESEVSDCVSEKAEEVAVNGADAIISDDTAETEAPVVDGEVASIFGADEEKNDGDFLS